MHYRREKIDIWAAKILAKKFWYNYKMFALK